ncbi:MAG: DUF547 domain-containing protein [Flavobacteriaceae bacterium]|nr:DUF547 domain-containing protein [Flavobacteriaceae bacterium]
MKNIFLLITLLFVFQSCRSKIPKNLPVKQAKVNLSYAIAVSEKVNHKAWGVLLKKYVDENGFVDYKGFLTSKIELTAYINYLSKNTPDENWDTQEQLAYYINLYNALTVQLILNNYPTSSIKDISKPWSKTVITLNNDDLSLGDIEHKILHKMNEPRIHFAINCASYSCPNLLNEAFTASKLEAQLNKVTDSFINGNKNETKPTNPKLSKIFKWYKKDFKVNGKPDVVAFINQYSNVKIDENARIDYLDYNWNLNEI